MILDKERQFVKIEPTKIMIFNKKKSKRYAKQLLVCGVVLSAFGLTSTTFANENYDHDRYLTEITAPKGNYKVGDSVPIQFQYTNSTESNQWINPKVTVYKGTQEVWSATYPVYLKVGETVDVTKNADMQNTFTIPSSVLNEDFTGYIVKVDIQDESFKTLSYKTMGLSVESNAMKFPRYMVTAGDQDLDDNGASYSITSKSLGKYAAEYEESKNMHMNVNMFYDVYKNADSDIYPMSGTFTQKWATFLQIQPTIDTDVVDTLVDWTHNNGSNAMLYNMANATTNKNFNKVSAKERLYDSNGNVRTYDMGNGALQYYYDLNSKSWQRHIASAMSAAMTNGKFDGWQIDTIGDAEVMNYSNAMKKNRPSNKQPVDTFWISDSFSNFLSYMNNFFTTKMVALNSVGGQGLVEAAKGSDIAYTEIWSDTGDKDSNKTNSGQLHTEYGDLKRQVDTVTEQAGKSLVVAAYQEQPNKNQGSQNSQYLDRATMLLVDATVAASGGYHMTVASNAADGNQYGVGLLSTQYYGNSTLNVSEELNKDEYAYQNFITGYENYLRGDGVTNDTKLAKVYNAKTGQQLSYDDNNNESSGRYGGQVWTFTKRGNGFSTIQMINLLGIDSEWANLSGKDKTPTTQSGLNVTYPADSESDAKEMLDKIYVTSPDDAYKGALTKVTNAYAYYDDTDKTWKVSIPVESLELWDMIIIND